MKEGRLTLAANPAMQRTESSLAATAEQLSKAARVVESLGIATKNNQSELQNLSFGLESEAKNAMRQYLMRHEPSEAVYEDPALCHIQRDSTHIQSDRSRKKPKEFSFDAAFAISKSGSNNIWVGEFKTKLTRDDVVTANKKKQELQEYINGAGSDHSGESELFQRQAAYLSFLSGREVNLFVGGARVMSDAETEVEKVSCVKLVPNGARFDVVEPLPR